MFGVCKHKEVFFEKEACMYWIVDTIYDDYDDDEEEKITSAKGEKASYIDQSLQMPTATQAPTQLSHLTHGQHRAQKTLSLLLRLANHPPPRTLNQPLQTQRL